MSSLNSPVPKKLNAAPKWLLFSIPSTLAILLVVSFVAFGAHIEPTRQPIAQKEAAHASTSGVSAKNLVSAIPNRGLPAQLEIPKIQVDAHVLYLGLTPNGSMAAPGDIVNVGWYKYGALPGNAGSAVIVGHLNGPHDQPGVFSNLSRLQPGDAVSVVDDKHQTVSFVVRSVQTYNQNDKPKDLFSSSGSHLNLITCTGAWDSTRHSYSQRLVVFTDKA